MELLPTIPSSESSEQIVNRGVDRIERLEIELSNAIAEKF